MKFSTALLASIVAAQDVANLYYPPSQLETFEAGHSLGTKPSFDSDRKYALTTIAQNLKLPIESIQVNTAYQDKNHVTHLYVSEIVNGIEVTNHNAAIHVRNGEVIAQTKSFKSKFSKRKKVPSEPKVSLEEAVEIAEKQIGALRDDIPAKQAFLLRPSGDLALVHQFQLKNENQDIFCQVSVDAMSGEVVQVLSYVSQFSIKALDLTANDPTVGFSVFGDESDSTASPLGWNDDGVKKYKNTVGNNVISTNNFTTVEGGNELNFDFEFNPKAGPTDSENIKASIVNTFYVANKFHDILYHYGFDEAAGNFQKNNFDKGGSGNDPVVVLNHYKNFKNNAQFNTPPDGQPGELRMFVWNETSPNRDSGVENSIVLHELFHGVSARLVGGPKNTNCLQGTAGGGINEGYSDIGSFLLSRKGTEKREDDFVIGKYVTGKPGGLRPYPLSVDMKKNPATMNFLLDNLTERHDVGVLWATTLFEIYWDLVDKYGFSSNWYNDKQMKGNIILLNNIVASLKTLSCYPGFVDARNALLSGDDQNYGGKHKCIIWKAFARRGMGVDASEIIIGPEIFVNIQESYKVPKECSS